MRLTLPRMARPQEPSIENHTTPWWQEAPAYPFPVQCADRIEGGFFNPTRIPGHNHVSLVYGPENRTYGIANCDEWLHARYLTELSNCGATQSLDLPRQTLPYREDWGALAWLMTGLDYGHEWSSLVTGGTEDTAFVRCARLGLQTAVQEGHQALADANTPKQDPADDWFPIVLVGVLVGLPIVGVLGVLLSEVVPPCVAATRQKTSDAAASVRGAWDRRPRLPAMAMPQMPALSSLWHRQTTSTPAAEAVPMDVIFTTGPDLERQSDARAATLQRATTPPPPYAAVEEVVVPLDEDTAAVLAEMEEAAAIAAPKPTLVARFLRRAP